MSTTKTVTETVKTTNPLEELFNIPSGSTEMTLTKPVTESESTPLYDDKDEELEKEFDTVKDMAHFTFETIQDHIRDVDPKYSARLYEVAATYLNMMHDTVKSKAKMKMEKDKTKTKKGGPNVSHTTNNTIISNTTDLIESIRNGSVSKTIDGDFTITQDDEDDTK